MLDNTRDTPCCRFVVRYRLNFSSGFVPRVLSVYVGVSKYPWFRQERFEEVIKAVLQFGLGSACIVP